MEVFLGVSQLLKNSWFFHTFPFGSGGPFSFLKWALLFSLLGGPRDAGGRQEARLALSGRSVRDLKTVSVCSLGSSESAVSALFFFLETFGDPEALLEQLRSLKRKEKQRFLDVPMIAF